MSSMRHQMRHVNVSSASGQPHPVEFEFVRVAGGLRCTGYRVMSFAEAAELGREQKAARA